MIFKFDSSFLVKPYYHKDNIFKLIVPGGMPLTFMRTSKVCPLQYDVFNKNGEKCGYVRYRSGKFTVDVVSNSIYENILLIEDENLEQWPDEHFMSLAARALDVYFTAKYC